MVDCSRGRRATGRLCAPDRPQREFRGPNSDRRRRSTCCLQDHQGERRDLLWHRRWLSEIVRAIRGNERVVLTLSTRPFGVGDFSDVCFSLPRIVGVTGVLATVVPELSAEEQQALTTSI